jgi:nitrogen fixation protein FixH
MESNEARARLFWCGLIIGLLMLQVVTGLAAVTLASADSSFAVVPGYHEQALNWDETQAMAWKSAALGWQAMVQATAEADRLGWRRLTVDLRDRAGLPLTGANVTAVVFHHAHATEAHEVRFVEATDGIYQVETPMRQNGLWEVRLNVTRGGDRFVISHEIGVGMAERGSR